MISEVTKLTAFALAVALNFSLSAQVDLHRTCGGQGEYEILEGKGFLPARHFNQAYLRKYFSRYLSYAETPEIYVLLIGDRKLAKENDVIDLVLSSPPAQTKAPIAHFWKIGRNAFFEFRDSAGKTEAVVLSGTNVLSPVVDGFPAVMATQLLTRQREDFSCRHCYPTTKCSPAPAGRNELGPSGFDLPVVWPDSAEYRSRYPALWIIPEGWVAQPAPLPLGEGTLSRLRATAADTKCGILVLHRGQNGQKVRKVDSYRIRGPIRERNDCELALASPQKPGADTGKPYSPEIAGSAVEKSPRPRQNPGGRIYPRLLPRDSPKPVKSEYAPREARNPDCRMDCAECTRHVRHAIEELPGVRSVEVFLGAQKAAVCLDSERVSLDQIRGAVARAGYRAGDAEAATRPLLDLASRSLSLLGLVAGAVLVIVLLGEWFGLLDRVLSLVPWWAALCIVLVAGYPVFWQVVRALTRGKVISHTLMTVGVVAAIAANEWATAAILVFFMRIGA